MKLRHDTLKPKDHAERVALFRAQVLGPLTCAQLQRGEQARLLSELSQRRYPPPGAKRTRTYSVVTLQRWLRAYRKDGLEALRPASRADPRLPRRRLALRPRARRTLERARGRHA
jgi:putative transposase